MNRLAMSALAGTLFVAALANAQQPAGTPVTAAPDAAVKAHEFVQSLRPHQWRVSKLIGVDVYGPDDEKLGDISDVLVAADGDQVIVIGVGGFLGLGDREVAVPLRSIEWRFGERPRVADQRSAPTQTEQGASAAPRKTVDNSRRGYPDFAVLRVPKELLKNAPEFRVTD